MNFSTFTAISELFVTAGVLYVVYSNWKRNPFPTRLAFGVAGFEFFVNMLYMVFRMQQAPQTDLSREMVMLFAIHGSLSLLVFVAYVTLITLAYLDSKKGRFYFAEHPLQTAIFVIFWLISVGSGEVIYFLRH